MWVFTEDGFFSTVVHEDNPAILAVRCRDIRSLLAFCARRDIDPSECVSTPDRDYPCRVIVDEFEWADYLANYVSRMKYGNFKDHCMKSGWPGKWISRLGDIWFLMATQWATNSQGDR